MSLSSSNATSPPSTADEDVVQPMGHRYLSKEQEGYIREEGKRRLGTSNQALLHRLLQLNEAQRLLLTEVLHRSMDNEHDTRTGSAPHPGSRAQCVQTCRPSVSHPKETVISPTSTLCVLREQQCQHSFWRRGLRTPQVNEDVRSTTTVTGAVSSQFSNCSYSPPRHPSRCQPVFVTSPPSGIPAPSISNTTLVSRMDDVLARSWQQLCADPHPLRQYDVPPFRSKR